MYGCTESMGRYRPLRSQVGNAFVAQTTQCCVRRRRRLSLGYHLYEMIAPPTITIAPVQFHEPMGESERRIAFRQYVSPTPSPVGLIFLEGLKSTMEGLKSTALEVESQVRLRCNCLRFDYQGHGLSSGDPDNISLCNCSSDTMEMFDSVCTREPQIVIGSSIGAWMALQVAIHRPQRVKALVLIAPAVDITEFWWRRLSSEEKQQAFETKRVPVHSEYVGEGGTLPLSFFQTGTHILLMTGEAKSIPVDCPVRIFHGLRDSVVPPSVSRELTEKLRTDDVHITLIKDGDHRLSRPQDLSAVLSAVQEMVDY